MAATGIVRRPATRLDPVTLIRVAIVAAALIGWELLSASGLLFQDVVPSFVQVVRAMAKLLVDEVFWRNFAVTGYEVLLALLIGGGAGLVVGLLVGSSRFLSEAYESLLHYFGPTPKIIFFPIMIMWFGVGPGSKIAMGAVSCFFPIAISAASGMRAVPPVMVRVGRSFRLSPMQMVTKIYLPAMRASLLNGVRLGLGIAIIGTMLAETKLSNQGLGYLVTQAFARFDMPQMYAMLILVFAAAGLMNALLQRLAQQNK